MSTVLIVDGNPLAWRGSLMYEGMRCSMGLETGSIFSALENFIVGIQSLAPDAVVIVWDHGKSRWRRELHPGYKLRRDAADKTPEERARRAAVLNQIQIAQTIFSAAGVKQVSAEGVEADDIIGILASGFDCLDTYDDVVILGSDKDLYQLVRGVVRIFDPIKKAWIDAQAVTEKLLVPPELVIDLKALTGDTGDDIPGVKGIGPKRAADLLKKYGSLDAVFDEKNAEHFEKYKWSQPLLTEETKALVQKARSLVTITNCMHMEPIDDLEKESLASAIWAHAQEVDRFKLSELLDYYEMRRTLSHMDLLLQKQPNFVGFEQWLF